jgi:TRAP-type C4-dicarboxylate transport system substrate-binding protein
MKSSLAGVLIGTALSISMAGAAMADKWVMPTPYADSNFHSVNIKQFAEEVKKESGGKLEIAVHTGASLMKLPEIRRAVQLGQVQIGETLMSSMANEDAIFEATNVPFLAKGFDKADILWLALKDQVEERLKKQGLVLLFAAPWPSQGVYSKEPLKDITDLKGSKMRTYDRVTARYAELLGAVPITVQAAEIPQAFATGIIHSMITSAATGVDTKAWEYVRNYYDFQAMIARNVVIANARAFAAIDPATQRVLLEAGKRAEQRATTAAKELEQKAKETLKERGVNVMSPPADMSAKMDKIGETLTDEWAKRAGVNGGEILKKLRSS